MMQNLPLPQGGLTSNGNGIGGFPAVAAAPAPMPPVAHYTNEEIIRMTNQHEQDVRPLRERMERDYNMYRLNQHELKDVATGDPLNDYAVYTSSEPRAFANKVISWLTQADVLLRVKHTNDHQHPVEIDTLKENLAIGLLSAADERLVRTLAPKLQATLAFQVAVRGGYIGGRCLLAQRPDGSTYVDITPFDPLNTHFGIGYDGLDWVCYKTRKTPQQIRDQYRVNVSGGPATVTETTNAETSGIYVYDFYDTRVNTVITQSGEVLKPPMPHGASRVPCYMVLVGNTPLIQPIYSFRVVADVGESVYESARGIYQKYNDIMSVMLELTARARRQGVKVFSADGKKTLPEDVYKEGTEVSLQTGKEDIVPLGMLEMAKETSEFLGQLSGEMQRATIPHSAYGELPFQLSGFAINSLRQGIETVLTPRIEAMEAIYLQIANLLYDQYMTERYSPMELSGVSQGRRYFSQTITPNQLQGSCSYMVDIVSQLPQDDMTKYQMAQMARAGANPLFADNWVREEILGIQDAEEAANQVKEQMAEHALPEAALLSLWRAAVEQNDPDLAELYHQALVQMIAAKVGTLPPGTTPPPGGTGGPPTPPGMPPQVMPQAAMGMPPSPLTSNNAVMPPQVPPATPRPGRG